MSTIDTTTDLKLCPCSTKRMTPWRGMKVAFTKSRTRFFHIAETMTNSYRQKDANGGRVLRGRELTLSDREQAEVLQLWREGKAEWCAKYLGFK